MPRYVICSNSISMASTAISHHTPYGISILELRYESRFEGISIAGIAFPQHKSSDVSITNAEIQPSSSGTSQRQRGTCSSFSRQCSLQGQ
jgi:hypothetical protein